MASYTVTSEAHTIIAARGESYLLNLGRVSEYCGDWFAGNRASEMAVRRAAAQVQAESTRTQALATSNTWTKVGGEWVVRPADGVTLTPGTTVTVTRKGGTSSTETVASVHNGYGYVVKSRHSSGAAHTSAQARQAAAALGFSGEIWDC